MLWVGVGFLALGLLVPVSRSMAQEVRGQEEAVLTDPPAVPPPIQRDYATKVVVHLEVREMVQRLADGVEYTF